MEAEVATLVAALTEKNAVRACGATAELCNISEGSDAVYPYFAKFCEMLTDRNSYVRNRGIALLAANVRYDAAHRLDAALPALLSCIMDEKPITARQCVKALPGIAAQRPDLAPRIVAALTEANPYVYAESMRPLVERDILTALREIEQTGVLRAE